MNPKNEVAEMAEAKIVEKVADLIAHKPNGEAVSRTDIDGQFPNRTERHK